MHTPLQLFTFLICSCYCFVVHSFYYPYIKTNLLKTSLLSSKLILDGLPAILDRKLRPSQLNIPRRRMELPFAVQLMRSSYNTLDEMDITPMDDFQKTFFLFRQSEWEDYKLSHPNIMQGDLSDSYYFDFISFAQYAVIADKMKNPLEQFVEKVGAEGETQVVRRNEKYSNTSLLPVLHSNMVGEIILNFLLEKYPAITPQDIISNSSIQTFLSNAQLLIDVMVINSYSLSGNISLLSLSDTGKTAVVDMTLRVPATLWSQQVLRGRKDRPCNDFENKLLSVLANRSGIKYDVMSSNVKNQIDMSHTIQLSMM